MVKYLYLQFLAHFEFEWFILNFPKFRAHFLFDYYLNWFNDYHFELKRIIKSNYFVYFYFFRGFSVKQAFNLFISLDPWVISMFQWLGTPLGLLDFSYHGPPYLRIFYCYPD